MGNLELLERAFNLAESGEVENIDQLRQTLLQDGVPISDLEQFRGKALSKQLCGKIKSAAKKRRKAQLQGNAAHEAMALHRKSGGHGAGA